MTRSLRAMEFVVRALVFTAIIFWVLPDFIRKPKRRKLL